MSGVPLGPLALDYSAAGAAWARGAEPVYGRLAEDLVARVPGGVRGATALDIGAGTGAGTRALLAAGAAQVVALDAALGMLAHAGADRPPAAVADATALPVADGSVDVSVAAFCFNHLTAPEDGLAEAARVLRPGGALVASAYADDDTHAVKAAVEQACRTHGWEVPSWYASMRDDAAPRLATIDAARAAADAAGLPGAVVEHVEVSFPELRPADLVEWRLGMAQVATFLASIDETRRAAVVADALAHLGDHPPPLVRRFIVVTWRK